MLVYAVIFKLIFDLTNLNWHLNTVKINLHSVIELLIYIHIMF